MNNIENFLGSLGLLKIEGYTFNKLLGGGSALSSLYSKGDEKIVFKFLISPRNSVELERFKLEFSVLEKNNANSVRMEDGFVLSERAFKGPQTSYPLPMIKHSLISRLGNLVNYFSYSYEDGQLLSQLDTSTYSVQDKINILYRIASGLSYFNQSGYSHRDLHPENILLLDGYHMPNSNGYNVVNDPRIKFLDMGNCQRVNTESDWLYRIERNLDENAVFQDNNRRILASFVSMPPDFLEKGESTKHYDSWSFGVYAYKLLFNEMPFEAHQIGDITALRGSRAYSEHYKDNLNLLPLGLKLILNHLLSPNGDQRPSIDAIVRLFSWLVDRNEEFQEHKFICSVIHDGGFDPNYDPRDDYY
ncbi:protein kinase domain-containing protein [Aliivibrio fischeri]|uniref:protein kinase domain-containing protein n=1 Tax=Aliivibrio fischeri TaxID=668 RepID=UPI0012D92A9F|nr:protein kinase [Aliivibrio fischeri]MUI54414.1 protein kinase [Aliivibrio fischeri]